MAGASRPPPCRRCSASAGNQAVQRMIAQGQVATPTIQRFEAQHHEHAERAALAAPSPAGAPGFTDAEASAVYFGNWSRDLSQALLNHPVIRTLGQEAVFEILNLLAMQKFGRELNPRDFGRLLAARAHRQPRRPDHRRPQPARHRRRHARAPRSRRTSPARKRSASCSPSTRPACPPTSAARSSTSRRRRPPPCDLGRTRRPDAHGQRPAHGRGPVRAVSWRDLPSGRVRMGLR